MITWSIILESMILTVWLLCSSMAPFTRNHFWSKRVTENCVIHPETFISEKLIQQNIYSNWYWSDIRFICTKLLGLTSSYLHFLCSGEIITPVPFFLTVTIRARGNCKNITCTVFPFGKKMPSRIGTVKFLHFWIRPKMRPRIKFSARLYKIYK